MFHICNRHKADKNSDTGIINYNAKFKKPARAPRVFARNFNRFLVIHWYQHRRTQSTNNSKRFHLFIIRSRSKKYMRIRWLAHSNRLNWIEIACLKNITEFRNTPCLNRPGNKEKKEEKGMEREEKLRGRSAPALYPNFPVSVSPDPKQKVFYFTMLSVIKLNLIRLTKGNGDCIKSI